MRMYLKHIATSGYTDAGDYPSQPFPAPVGFEWVNGPVPPALRPYVQLSIRDKIQGFFLSRIQNKLGDFKGDNNGKRQFGKIMQISTGLDRAFELASKFPKAQYKEALRLAVEGCILDADVPPSLNGDKQAILDYALNLIDTEAP